jgi:hypothetical protein
VVVVEAGAGKVADTRLACCVPPPAAPFVAAPVAVGNADPDATLPDAPFPLPLAPAAPPCAADPDPFGWEPPSA